MRTGKLVVSVLSVCWAMCILAPAVAGAETTTAEETSVRITDHGKRPWILDIEEATISNENFRIANWTGNVLQLTLMSIEPGGEIGLEMHEGMDQFIRIEEGNARVVMGRSEDSLTFDEEVTDDWAIFIPDGYWHNIINTGDGDLKLYAIYAPPEHPMSTIHPTYEDAEEDHHHH